MAKLEPGKVLKRDVKVYGVEGLVVVALSHEGVTFKVKGTKLGVSATWPELIEACPTPQDLPSKFAGQSYAFLQHQGKKRQAGESKRLQSKIAEELKERNPQ